MIMQRNCTANSVSGAFAAAAQHVDCLHGRKPASLRTAVIDPFHIAAAMLWLLLGVGLPAQAWAQKVLAPATIEGSRLVSAHEAAELIASTPALRIIDCRLPEEYAKGHIEGSINITDNDLTAAVLARHAPDKTTPLLFYCNGPSCLRSARSVEKAVGWGYGKVHWFRGGMEEWLARRLPLTR